MTDPLNLNQSTDYLILNVILPKSLAHLPIKNVINFINSSPDLRNHKVIIIQNILQQKTILTLFPGREDEKFIKVVTLLKEKNTSPTDETKESWGDFTFPELYQLETIKFSNKNLPIETLLNIVQNSQIKNLNLNLESTTPQSTTVDKIAEHLKDTLLQLTIIKKTPFFVVDTFLKNCINIKKLKMFLLQENSQLDSSDLFKSIANNCKNLEELYHHNWSSVQPVDLIKIFENNTKLKSIDFFELKEEINQTVINELNKYWENLEDLNIHSWLLHENERIDQLISKQQTKLTNLYLDNCPTTTRSIENTVINCINIHSIHLSNCLFINGKIITKITPSIEEIKIYNCDFLSNTDLTESVKNCPNIKEFSCNNPTITSEDVKAIFLHCPLIKTLYLENAVLIENNFIEYTHTNIESIFLRNCPNLNQNAFFEIIDNCKKIKKICVINNLQFDNRTINRFLKNCKYLETITITNIALTTVILREEAEKLSLLYLEGSIKTIQFEKTFPQLKVIFIEGERGDNTLSLDTHCPNLNELSIKKFNITIEEIMQILKDCPLLQSLDVDANLTYNDVEAILNSGKSLKDLSLKIQTTETDKKHLQTLAKSKNISLYFYD